VCCLLLCSTSRAQTNLTLTPDGLTELLRPDTLYAARDDNPPPDDPRALEVWRATLTPVPRVNLFGGQYWIIARITNPSSTSDWILDPSGSILERVDAWLSGPSGTQRLEMGYNADYEYLLHYGKHVTFVPGGTYTVIVRFESPYFASFPNFRVLPRGDYVRFVGWDTALTLGALGALVMLAFYNFFIYSRTRDSSLFFYSAYLLTYAVGWGLTFNLGAHLLGIRNLHWHYVPFFLLPVLNTLFYLRFLHLDKYHKGLARFSRFVIALSLVLLPSCFLALSYAHALATLVIGLFVFTAFISGVVVWRRGFAPARFFVLAFLCLLVPALFILPGNIGLLPDYIDNSELWTLLGGTLDGLLLAFALAERINQLQRDKDTALSETQRALTLAHTDALTKLGNRQAFERDTDHLLEGSALIAIDLDGLKRVNDRHGHARGDALLRAFAAQIKAMPYPVSTYRVGGDEFMILSSTEHVQAVCAELERIEAELRERGFAGTGVSYGVASVTETREGVRLTELADTRMYQHKFQRREALSGV
jgi:diguanylate cyclase (GGDEF)-like protein